VASLDIDIEEHVFTVGELGFDPIAIATVKVAMNLCPLEELA